MDEQNVFTEELTLQDINAKDITPLQRVVNGILLLILVILPVVTWFAPLPTPVMPEFSPVGVTHIDMMNAFQYSIIEMFDSIKMAVMAMQCLLLLSHVLDLLDVRQTFRHIAYTTLTAVSTYLVFMMSAVVIL